MRSERMGRGLPCQECEEEIAEGKDSTCRGSAVGGDVTQGTKRRPRSRRGRVS